MSDHDEPPTGHPGACAPLVLAGALVTIILGVSALVGFMS